MTGLNVNKNSQNMLNPQVFKAYDIRGIYGTEWDAAGAGLIARAFVEEFKLKTVVLGWDMRISSPEMVATIEEAVLAAGARLIKVGEVTTPILYYATAGLPGNDGGIMVTASHNTGEWNGMKMLLGDGAPVGETSGLQQIKERALAGEFVDAARRGSVGSRLVIDSCFDQITSLVKLDDAQPLSVVIDCGNGMAGATIHQLLARYPAMQARVLYDTPDGTFPHHEANPLKEETLADLKKAVLDAGADFGAAYDGDGDRIGFVDENGAMVGGDVMTGLIGAEIARAQPGATILYDLRMRRAVARAIKAAGGRPEMSRVGHAFIKKQMRELGAAFAGELSCHYYFKEYYGVECADLMLLYVARLIQQTGKSLSELAARFLTDAHSGEINFDVHDRDAALARIKVAYASRAHRVSELDGLLCEMGDWWFNVRPSNTEPVLRLNAEAYDGETLKQKISEISSLIS